MALLFIDGFDHYDPQAIVDGVPALSRGKATYLSPIARRTNGRRPGSWALDLNDLLRPEGGQHGGYAVSFDAARETLICGAAIRVKPYSVRMSMLGMIDDTGTVEHDVVLDIPNYRVLLWRIVNGDARLAGEARPVVFRPSWNYVELKITSDTASGGMHVRLNGDLVLSGTGLNTRRDGGLLKTVYIGTAGNRPMEAFIDVDDFYVADTSGTVNNDFLGDVRIDTLAAAGAGPHGEWLPVPGNVAPWQAVSDNDDATGIETQPASGRHVFRVARMPALPRQTVYGVQVAALARRLADDPPLRAIVVSGEQSTAGSQMPADPAMRWRTAMFDRDPVGSKPWSAAAVDAAYFGVESIP